MKIYTGFLLCLLFLSQSVHAQHMIRGTVVDDQTNEILLGANVLVKGTILGGATNQDGEFNFEVPSLPVTLVISYIGYTTKEVDVQTTDVGVVHMVAGLMIDEVVVVGSRGRPRTILDSPVPIDNINAADLQSSGQKALDQMIQL